MGLSLSYGYVDWDSNPHYSGVCKQWVERVGNGVYSLEGWTGSIIWWNTVRSDNSRARLDQSLVLTRRGSATGGNIFGEYYTHREEQPRACTRLTITCPVYAMPSWAGLEIVTYY